MCILHSCSFVLIRGPMFFSPRLCRDLPAGAGGPGAVLGDAGYALRRGGALRAEPGLHWLNRRLLFCRLEYSDRGFPGPAPAGHRSGDFATEQLRQDLFGGMYGAGVFALYAALGWMGAPTFYDKLLCVPPLNLMVSALDRAALALGA